MIRAPHQSDDYIEAEFGHEDEQDGWDARNSLTPSPSLVALLEKLREGRAA